MNEDLLPEFEVRDPELWQRFLDNNPDSYGACINRYAKRWGRAMQAEMATGKKLVDIAESTSMAADTEGITGFMYGAAVATLVGVWSHGEDLRRWHNKDIQIGDEGDRANEDGGILNPAVLVMG